VRPGSTIAGADGCRGGWIVIQQSGPASPLSWRVVPTLDELFSGSATPDLVAVDIPIGLPEKGARGCDREARRRLGPKRGTSVFPAPIRKILDAGSYEEGCQLGLQADGRKISRQVWAILPKIAEVDRLLRENPNARARVHEVHPEVSFFYLNGERPVELPKRKRPGRDARAELIRGHFGDAVDEALKDRRLRGLCRIDDLLDAFAALWTAARIVENRAIPFPESARKAEQDESGLQMEILA
jgi:predicted RNase H-like nuclease